MRENVVRVLVALRLKVSTDLIQILLIIVSYGVYTYILSSGTRFERPNQRSHM